MDATFISDTDVTCLAPPQPPGLVCLDLAMDGSTFTSCGIRFSYVPRMRLSSVSPTRGEATKSALVTIRGDGFSALSQTDSVWCDWSGTRTHATVVSNNRLTCLTPNLGRAANVNLTLALGNVPVASNDLNFEFFWRDSVPRLVPDHGPATGGTTTVVHDSSWPADSTPSCVFVIEGHRHVAEPLLREDHEITCAVPPYSGATPDSGGARLAFAGLSLPGSDHDSSQLAAFWYRNALTLARVEPSTSGVAGGGVVAVTGGGWYNSDRVTGRFGTMETKCTVVSPTVVTCPVPAAAGPSSVRVHLSTSGEDYSAASLSFEYLLNATASARVLDRPVRSYPKPIGISARTTDLNVGRATLLEFEGSYAQSLVACRLQGLASPTHSLAATRVGCAVTCLVPGVSLVETSSDGSTFAGSSYSVHCRSFPVVSSVHPQFGPVSGGSLLTITGTGIESGANLRCQFGTVGTPATRISDTTATCATQIGRASCRERV